MSGPVPSSRRLHRGQRVAAAVVPDHQILKQLLRELRRRSGLTDAEIGRRMGVSRQAVTEVQHSFDTTDHKRRVSLLWAAKYAAICGGRFILEFPEEQ